MQLSAMYELGWCHYLLLDFEKCTSVARTTTGGTPLTRPRPHRTAISYLDAFLSESKAASFRAYAAYQLGNSYALLGRQADAMTVFRAVPAYARKVIRS
jgi:hypothetical protein